MERFIGFNDSQENTNIIKKAIKILSLEIDKYFKTNKQKLEFRNSSKEKDEKWVENFVTIPASVYYDISNNDILIQCYKNPFKKKLIKTREYGANAMTVPKSSGSIQPMRGPLALSSTPLQQEAGGNTAVIILGVKLTGTGNGWGFPLVPVVFATSPS